MREAEELRKRSIAAVYKQLAKVLHPDLEPNAAQRERTLVLMQDLTAAYRNNDLHSLLRLEQDWIRREEGNLERLTQEKLSIYNQVLREQALDLEHELESLPYLPRYRPLVVIDGPFQMRLRTDGPNEAREIDASIATMNAAIFQLRSDNAIRHLRNIVREYRRMDDFTCPF
ncbi:MAG: hypothetical protein HY646_09535 [Acidobacteria bacterium]|nr:hypothetical protein [Acidobacteriota bacterium]